MSNLFGSGATGQQSGGLFGNPQQSTQPQNNSTFGTAGTTSNLFGNTGGNNQSSSNLFGGSGANTQSSSTSNLFGNAGANTQSSTSNVFGGNAGSNAQSSTSNIFGNNASTSAGTQGTQSGTSNLFGSNVPQQTQTGSNLFGGSQPQSQPQQQSGFGAGLFGGGANAQSGTNTSQPAAGSSAGKSLFDRITPASSTTASQAPGTTGPTLGSGLFGGAQTTAAQAPPMSSSTLGGGLFGQNFGAGLGASSASQPQPTGSSTLGAGLFGGTSNNQSTTTQQQQQPGLGASTFGASNFGASILNNQAGASTTQAPGQNGTQTQNGLGSTASAHFQSLLERGKKRQDPNARAQFSNLPDLQLGLGDIASKVRKLGGSDSPSKSRGATARDLNDFGSQAWSRAPPRPSIEDLDDETDVSTWVAGLRAKHAQDVFRETMEQTKRDFDAFVAERIEINYEEQKQRIYEHFGLTRPRLGRESDDSPTTGGAGASFGGSFGGKSSQKAKGSTRFANGSFGSPGMTKSVLGGSVTKSTLRGSLFPDVAAKTTGNGFQTANDNPWLRTKEEKYAEKLKELNSARLQETIYPVIESFANVELESGGDTPAHIIDAYRAIKQIAGENSQGTRPSDPGMIRERQYVRDYLDEGPNSVRSVNMRKRIIDGSRKFLEDSFFAQLEDLIAKNPREANLGGIPTKINKVRAYVRLRATRKSLGAEVEKLQMLGNDYCWVLIYFLLRCGLVKEAAQYISENERAIKSMDRHFSQYITAFTKDPDRRLPRELANQMNVQYSQRSKAAENSIDPFRMACYKILGRCDVGRRNIEGIHVSMEDWAWLVFSLAREVNRVEEPAAEVFGLQEARDAIESVGQRHFVNASDAGTGYATYFLLLTLSGQFEQAIAWLYPHNYVSAVHFAIALDFYGLLRVSNLEVAESELLTFTTRGQPQISFARLLGYYTRDFRLARPEAATDYLILICLNADLPGTAGESQAQVCNEALKDLVLETREFAQLLGDMQGDGKRVKGAIEQRLPLIRLGDDINQAEFLKSLTLQAAAVADDSGRTTDAVLLYHLAEEYDSVIGIVTRALSDAIAVPIGQEPYRMQPLKPRNEPNGQAANAQQQNDKSTLSLTAVDNPADLAQHMMYLYQSNGVYLSKISQANQEACTVLLRLSAAKERVAAGRWAEALDIIISVDILPIQVHSDISKIRSYAQQFNNLQPVVARNVSSLLMWTIECCGRQRDVFRNAVVQNTEMANTMVSTARDLMVFAGLIRYKLPQDVFEVLARAGQDIEAM